MAFVGKLTAFVVVLVFAAGASAATCADGSSTGSNGCCAATLECPPCLFAMGVSFSDPPTAGSTTCTCNSCDGDTVRIDSTCTSDTCPDDRSWFSWMGCEMCTGASGACMTNAAAVSACNTYAQSMGMSIDSSSGLISTSGGGGDSCDACCPTGCDGPADASKPECKACNACQTQGTACPSDSAAASLGSGALGTTLLAATTTALLRGLLF